MGNPCSSGHPHKVTGHSVQLQHQRLTAYWPALISKNTITRIKVLFSSVQPWITSGALYLGLGLVGGNAIPTKERRVNGESLLWWECCNTQKYRDKADKFCSASWGYNGRWVIAAVQKKNKKLRETLILNHSEPGRSNNREVPVFTLFHEWWKNS